MKQIGDNLLTGLSLAGLEINAFSLLRNVTPDDCYRAIESNKPWVIADGILEWARPAYKRFAPALEKYTAGYVLEKLRRKRPELYSVIITHPNGKAWLEARISELRQQLEQLGS